ncbi:hypothetical protein Fcan01_25880 [Folsomia candida]|uniref:Uncharacterized protein n=1 Tax=Folsomia candida TaxID=158441 RepID=A0A226D4U1_FOLCA|nr:hypothetical protein Fcan01_25880 [Folsomia candida]
MGKSPAWQALVTAQGMGDNYSTYVYLLRTWMYQLISLPSTILSVQGGLFDIKYMNLMSTTSFVHNHLAFQYYIFVTAAKHEIQEYFRKLESLEMFGLKQVVIIDMEYLLEDTLLLRMHYHNIYFIEKPSVGIESSAPWYQIHCVASECVNKLEQIGKNVSNLNKYFWSTVTAFGQKIELSGLKSITNGSRKVASFHGFLASWIFQDVLKHDLTHVRPLYSFTPIIRLNNWGSTWNIFFLHDVQTYSFVSCHQTRSNSDILTTLSSPLDDWSWALLATHFTWVVLILILLPKQLNSDGILLMIGISLENSVLSGSIYKAKFKPTKYPLIGLNTFIGVWTLLVGTILTNWYKSIFTMEMIVPTMYRSPWTTVMDVEGIRILMPFKLMGEHSVDMIKFDYFRHKYFYTQLLFRCHEIAIEPGKYKRLMVYKNRAKALVNMLRPHFGMDENLNIKYKSGVFTDFHRPDEPHPFNKSVLKGYPIQSVDYNKADSYNIVKILSTCEKVALIDKAENIVKITNFLNDNQEKRRFVRGDGDHFFRQFEAG